MSIKLMRPAPEHEAQVMQYKAAMLTSGDSFDGCAGLEEVETYAEWLDFDARIQAKGWVPSEVFLAVRQEDGKVVGIMDFRHPLTPFLLQYGGNIGYSVAPDERRKGYATKMLSLLLPICKQYGEEKVLLTCDKTNHASRRTILKNGGVLENEVVDDVGLGRCGIIERYWIML